LRYLLFMGGPGVAGGAERAAGMREERDYPAIC
jgi:hypothetical protein